MPPMFPLRLEKAVWLFLVVFAPLLPPGFSKTDPLVVSSPNQKISVIFEINDGGAPCYRVDFEGKPVLQESRLGLVRDDADFSAGMKLLAVEPVCRVDDHYEILTAKRRVNHYLANREVFHLSTQAGQAMDVIFQVSDDGFAFRYFFPGESTVRHALKREASSFHFLSGTTAWLQPMSVSKTGWMRTNPAYEEYYEKGIPAGTPSPTSAGWVYPALFRSGEVWLVISEGSLSGGYCGTHLRAAAPAGEYSVAFADERETVRGGRAWPESKLPWLTPWRLVAVGSLQTVAESMLGVDLADPCPKAVAAAAVPGKASWSWPLLGDGSATFEVQKRFIDYAAEMHWRYCLIDALWDVQIGYEKMQILADYARTKNVALLLWYNSAGDWNDAPQTPRDRLLTHESRVAEFERLKGMGIAGLKIDFFGGDGQSVIEYYRDILEDAAPYGFAMNFHGATLPRGWQRTYPNLMTMEAIKGLEYITFDQRNADEEPAHAAMLPFTRNLFDPMDFTPMVLDRIASVQRRTTSAFELALSVLFVSGIQHYAEIPEGMEKAPVYVKEFLRGLPSVWDDVRFVDGFPGRYVAIARRGAGRWYLAGINGENAPRTLSLDLSRLGPVKSGRLIGDGTDGALLFCQKTVALGEEHNLTLTLPAYGGFVVEFDPSDGAPSGLDQGPRNGSGKQ